MAKYVEREQQGYFPAHRSTMVERLSGAGSRRGEAEARARGGGGSLSRKNRYIHGRSSTAAALATPYGVGERPPREPRCNLPRTLYFASHHGPVNLRHCVVQAQLA